MSEKRKHIREMRQRLGLDNPDDTKFDARIEKMSPMERLELLCGWHIGDPLWASSFLSWARDSGFKITE